ncbi:MAG: hypothetical protein QXZ02_04075 [Candidatus Bathyarchaeia archaeon]
MATASPSSEKRITLYASSSGRRRPPSKLVVFRLPLPLYGLLRMHAPNVSGLLRRLVVEFLKRLPSYLEIEEFRLELEVEKLGLELERVHRWQKLVLKHGSYAQAYLQELKGGVVYDRKPYYTIKPRPEVKVEEKLTVQSIIEYREALAKQLVEKLNRLITLKKANLQLEGGEKA